MCCWECQVAAEHLVFLSPLSKLSSLYSSPPLSGLLSHEILIAGSQTKRLHKNYRTVLKGQVKVHDVYENYVQNFCHPCRQEPQHRASFGKALRVAFPKLLKKRLRAAGMQASYYIGIVLMVQPQPLDELATQQTTESSTSPVDVLFVAFEASSQKRQQQQQQEPFATGTTLSFFSSSLLWDPLLPEVLSLEHTHCLVKKKKPTQKGRVCIFYLLSLSRCLEACCPFLIKLCTVRFSHKSVMSNTPCFKGGGALI